MNAARLLLMLAVVQFGWISSAAGGLILSIDDLTLPAGGTGFIDVTIGSDANDPLNLFLFEFQIVPVGAPAGRIEFTDPQPDPQLTDPAYVFAGDSVKQSVPLPVGNVGQTLNPGDTFLGEDFTASSNDVILDATERLFVRLEVTAATALPPAVGDQFTIVLSDANSLFFNSQSTPVLFASTSGTVTIAAPASVPEPTSISLLCLGALGLAAAGRRSMRRRTNP